jgi:molybdopterin/thiamine biosynthesis adenylyltransferase
MPMDTELDQLANRHLRADPQGVLADVAGPKPGVVLVQIDASIAAAKGAQHLAWMLVSLLSRQFKVVTEILIDAPAVALLPGVAPFGEKETLIDTLKECVALISGPHVKVSRSSPEARPDVALIVGDGISTAPNRWRLYADGWRYFVGQDGFGSKTSPQSDMSIGPYLCASYAAGEVFKLLRGMKPGKGVFIEAFYASAWTMSDAHAWDDLLDGPDADHFGPLPHFYFAGAGAVAQAAALTLGSSNFSGSCTTVDKDALDLSNGNRYALSTKDDEEESKVTLMQRYLESRGFASRAIPEWWQTFAVSGGRYASSAAIRTLERAYKFPIVFSCVDKNGPRHDLQNALPELLFGGSTDGLTAKASIFHLGSGTACLKCHNPRVSRNAVVEERIATLKKLDVEGRSAFAEKHGFSDADVALLLSPSTCGKLSEGDLDRFSAGGPEMSVGFVSMAAGVLQVAQFLRYLELGSAAIAEDGAMAVATFARPRLRSMHVGRDRACNCETSLLGRWRAVWTAATPA